METNFRQSRPLQHLVEHFQHTVRGDGAACGRWEYILAVRFPLLILEDLNRILANRHAPIGIFRFQRRKFKSGRQAAPDADFCTKKRLGVTTGPFSNRWDSKALGKTDAKA